MVSTIMVRMKCGNTLSLGNPLILGKDLSSIVFYINIRPIIH